MDPLAQAPYPLVAGLELQLSRLCGLPVFVMVLFISRQRERIRHPPWRLVRVNAFLGHPDHLSLGRMGHGSVGGQTWNHTRASHSGDVRNGPRWLCDYNWRLCRFGTVSHCESLVGCRLSVLFRGRLLGLNDRHVKILCGNFVGPDEYWCKCRRGDFTQPHAMDCCSMGLAHLYRHGGSHRLARGSTLAVDQPGRWF